MQSNGTPRRFLVPFANSAGSPYVRDVSNTSLIGVTDGAASMPDGFPPDTFLAEGAGGIPPDGRDVNGILRQLTAWARWQAAGAPATYDSAFATSVGGYPKGAQVASSTGSGLIWVSTAENNATDPDGSSAANWAAAGDLGHSYNANGGYFTIGPLLFNFGHTALTDASGRIGVTFARAFAVGPLWTGAANDCGGGYPSSWAGVGAVSNTGMNIGMSVGGAPGGAGSPASTGTAAFWWAIGL